MRVVRVAAFLLAVACPAWSVAASCIAPQDLDRAALVHDIASTMTVMDAAVEQPIDQAAGRGELLRPLRIYVGERQPAYRIVRGVGGESGRSYMVWTSNDQFHDTRGEWVFEVLRPVSAAFFPTPRLFRGLPIASAFETLNQIVRQVQARAADPAQGYQQIGCERYYLRDDPSLLREVAAHARALGR